jgi:predicted esterase
MIPLERVKPVAERLGYVIISSYNTLSDTTEQPNVDALNAMLTDLQRFVSIDPHRLYLIGFSGTARLSWDFASQLKGNVAGVVGVGAGLPDQAHPPLPGPGEEASFVFFGGAGTGDFNYDEVRGLDQYLDSLSFPHRMRYYGGPHGWPPSEVFTEAVEWLELMAIRRSLTAPKPEWLDSVFRRRLQEAASLESSGNLFAAGQSYAEIAADFQTFRDVSIAQGKARALRRSKEVRGVAKALEKAGDDHTQYVGLLRRFLSRVRDSREPPSLSSALAELDIRTLQKRAADRSDTIAAQGASRQLEDAFVVSSFYEPRAYLAEGDGRRALVMLDLAEAIHPGLPHVCESRRQALRLADRAREADSLECPSRPTPSQ